MALNIKNERVHALARQAADRTGTTQVAAIETALERYLNELLNTPTRAERIAAVRADIAALGLTDADRAAARTYMDEMYDDAGLPR